MLISGGGSNLLALLEAAAQPEFPAQIVAVGSDTDAPGLQHADRHDVPTFIVRPRDFADRSAWGDALAAAVRAHLPADEPGLVVSAGFMRILPPKFVNEFSPRLINTHPALLPNFPGAHAVRDALAAGVHETGVTVHVIDEGVDTGRALRQHSVPVEVGDTEEEVHERIKAVERPLLVATVRDIASGALNLSLTETSPDHSPATD